MAKNRLNHIILTDENGQPVQFTLPHYALFFNTGLVTCEGEMKCVITQQKLADQYLEKRHDVETKMIDLESKERYVKRLQKTGRWI